MLRSLINKAFTPRAIQSQRETVEELIDHYLGQVDPDNFDVVQDFSGPFPVEVITRMAGVPEEYRQQVRHWIDTSPDARTGQDRLSPRPVCRPTIDSGMYYYSLAQERRANPQDDMISRLIAAEIVGEDGELRKLDDIEIAGFASLLGGAGAETVTKLVGSAMVTFAKNPDQWQKLLDDRSKVPAAVEEMLRFDGPVHYNVRYTLKDAHLHGTHDPGRQAGVHDEGRRQPGSAGLHRRAHLRYRPRPHRSAEPRLRLRHPQLPRRRPGTDGNHRSRWSDCSISCRATRSSGTDWRRSTCRTSRDTTTSRSRCCDEARSKSTSVCARATGSAWASSRRCSTSTTRTICTS